MSGSWKGALTPRDPGRETRGTIRLIADARSSLSPFILCSRPYTPCVFTYENDALRWMGSAYILLLPKRVPPHEGFPPRLDSRAHAGMTHIMRAPVTLRAVIIPFPRSEVHLAKIINLLEPPLRELYIFQKHVISRDA